MRALIAFDAYLLALLAAAARGLRRPPPVTDRRLRFAVLVPARNEEAAIGATLASLRALDRPAEIIVVADGCTDATAEVAAKAGATVWARPGSGKGAALAWALGRLPDDVDAVAIVDADCTVTPNLLTAFEARLTTGAEAVQARNEVANPEASWAAGLRFASLALMNTVRPLGRATLGLSAGLTGTGMAFSTALLQRCPWASSSLVEDREQHLRFVDAGVRVAFAPEAAVRSPAVPTLARARAQQRRWDGGRWALAREWAPRLLRRDPARLDAALELIVPPQSVLLAAGVAATVPRATRRRALVALAGQAAFVLGGLAVVRAPAAVWRSLAFAPLLAADKLVLLAGQPRSRAPMRRSWSRWAYARSSGSARGARRTPASAQPAK
jgi:hypothetical protein